MQRAIERARGEAMVSTRGKAASVEESAIHWKEAMEGRRRSPSPPSPQAALSPTAPASPADYERLRGERIKENMERLRSFGILDLSLQLKSHLPSNPSHQPRRKRGDVTLLSSTSQRRSSRCFLFSFFLSLPFVMISGLILPFFGCHW